MLTEIEVYLTCDPETMAVSEEQKLKTSFPQDGCLLIVFDDEQDQMVASIIVEGETEEANLEIVKDALKFLEINHDRIEVVKK